MNEQEIVQIPSEKLQSLVDGYVDLVDEVDELRSRVNGLEDNVMRNDEMSSKAHQAATDAVERVEKTRIGQRRLKDTIDENEEAIRENSWDLKRHKDLIDDLYERELD